MVLIAAYLSWISENRIGRVAVEVLKGLLGVESESMVAGRLA